MNATVLGSMLRCIVRRVGLRSPNAAQSGHARGLAFILAMLIVSLCTPAHAAPDAAVSHLQLTGSIEGENVIFTLSFDVDVARKGTTMTLVEGHVGYLSGSLPSKSTLTREGASYVLRFNARGRQHVQFEFASLPVKDQQWRETSFVIPNADIRKLSMTGDREDLEIVFPGSLSIDRATTGDGLVQATAYLGASDAFTVRWKPEVRQLDGELAVECDANAIATANVGALRIDTVFTYHVIQGRLDSLQLMVPPELNVTRVEGADILEWDLSADETGMRVLSVRLNQPREGTYRLGVYSELILPDFPSAFALPVVHPLDVIRTSGFLMIGTDSAIKLLVNRAVGLTQVDHDAFPVVTPKDGSTRQRRR